MHLRQRVLTGTFLMMVITDVLAEPVSQSVVGVGQMLGQAMVQAQLASILLMIVNSACRPR